MRRGVVNKFNRGEVDPRAMLRDDVPTVENSCELMTNFMPLRLGPMQTRPGTINVGIVTNESYIIPFMAKADDTALLEFSANAMRVWVDDALVTRTASNLTLTNGGFAADIASWTDASGVGSTAVWDASNGGSAKLTGATSTSSKIWQTFGNSGSYLGLEHGITITIFEAPVTVTIGESGVDSDDIFSGTLGPGVHSFVITPVAALPTVTLSSSLNYSAYVGEVTVDTAGELSLPLPISITTLSSLRHAQSADVVYCATLDAQQFKIERRGVKSWSAVTYQTGDGPFGLINNTDITLAAAALSGNTTLTASGALFTAASVGSVYKLSSSGQTVTASVSAQDDGTNPIRVTGVEDARKFTLTRSGTWSGTVTLQRSTDASGPWQDIEDYGGNGSKTYDDNLDNAILYYRLWVKTGDYTSGTVVLDIVYTAGSIDGRARVTEFTSSTVAQVQVLEAFGSLDATRDWYLGEWNGVAGYPSAVALYEGRLWWAGLTKLWGSVSDQFESFDTTVEGDSASIRRTIGFGPVDSVDWLAPSSRLIMGIASDEISVRSSSFGEVLTPTNTNLKSGSTRGVAPVEPLKLDDALIYVQRSAEKMIGAKYDIQGDSHVGADLMLLAPHICKDAGGIKRIVVSREPETRIFVLMNDGTMRVWLSEMAEDVRAWSRIETADTFIDVVVKPSDGEDNVYVQTLRNGVRYLERFAFMSQYDTIPHDAAVTYVSPGTLLTGLGHLNGRPVGVWADGADRGDVIVVAGQATVAESWTNVTVGLRYNNQYKSMRVGGYVKTSVVGRRKRIVDLSLSALDFWHPGISVGPSFDSLSAAPEIEYGYDTATIINDYDALPFTFDGEEETDPRICIQATGPCTILALTYGVLQDGDQGGDAQ